MPVAAKFSTSIQTNPGVHLACCTMGTRALPWEVEQPGFGINHPPHPALRLKRE